MTRLTLDVDEVLKKLASESVKQGENLRAAVRDLTLNALDDLGHFEDELLKTVKQASESANEKIKAQWGSVLGPIKIGGTETGAQVAATMQQFGEGVQAAMRQQREAGFKAAHMLSQNFATLASGVLIGLSEGTKDEGRFQEGQLIAGRPARRLIGRIRQQPLPARLCHHPAGALLAAAGDAPGAGVSRCRV